MSTEISAQIFDTSKIVITHQGQNGCVTSAAESLFRMFGVTYETDFLPDFRKYNIEDGNPNNNHMLGLVPTAVAKNFDVSVHIKPKFGEYVLTESSPLGARKIHSELLTEIETLSQKGKIILTGGHLDLEAFRKRISDELQDGRRAIIALDWGKWAIVGKQMKIAQEKFGNPFHAVHLFKIDDGKVSLVDPSLEESENPVIVTIGQLYSSLHETQQMVFIGKNGNKS